MARDPAITFRGALRILGKDEPAWLSTLDQALGGVILTSGVAPTANAVWNWIDQKNEAIRLLRSGFTRATDQMPSSSGLHRHELVIAAHTILVLTAFFDAANRSIGRPFRGAKMTDHEKVLVAIASRAPSEGLIRYLYDAIIPSPSTQRGFEANVLAVQAWAKGAAEKVAHFLRGLDLGPLVVEIPSRLVADYYRSGYSKLMTAVPEFALWAEQVEHGATQSALGRLEKLLQLGTQKAPRDLCATVAATNKSELSRPVLDVDTDGYGMGAIFPTVEEIFVSPSYRLAGSVHDDLDLLLARHFTSADATTSPMLLLGHPGAGKSLLMKVLAGKLPDSRFTIVRVPLRSVEANAPVIEQIRQALHASTNGRVDWAELSDSSSDTVRVILLDGLDELLQATNQDRHGYLHEIMEFQRVESVMERPVAVIVTSRTLVADRVAIPNQAPVVEIEAFEEPQIADWIERWNRANLGGQSRPMRLDIALTQSDIARQPLLLLMLTLYYADPEIEFRTDLSTSQLYGNLLNTYARREVTKRTGQSLRSDRVRRATRDQLRRLAIAALGMFNRGRQSVTEAQLSADLTSLNEESTSGERVLGEFFFVHAAQASSTVYGKEKTSTTIATRRSYEFLHATFAEYLVALHIVTTIAQVASTTVKDGTRPRPDDDLLFALLSHQPISIQRPVLEFVNAHYRAATQRERNAAIRTLNLLLTGYRSRPTSRHFTEYKPTARDHVRALASYSANLVLLRISVSSGDPVKITEIWSDGDPKSQWRSCVALWQAGMDDSGYRSILSALWQSNNKLSELQLQLPNERALEVHRSLLRGDNSTAHATALGETILRKHDPIPTRRYLKATHGDYRSLVLELLRSLPVHSWTTLVPHLDDSAPWLISEGFASDAWELLGNKPGPWPPGMAAKIARIALKSSGYRAELVAAAAFRHREVFDLVSDLADTWTGKAQLVYQMAMSRHGHPAARIGWVYVSKARDVLGILLSDGAEYDTP